MRIQINGARIIDPASGMDQQADIFIDDGKSSPLVTCHVNLSPSK